MAIKTNFRVFDELRKKIEKLDGKHEVAAKDLFHLGFMKANTKYLSFDEMVDASGITVQNIGDLDDSETWSTFVRDNSVFDGWHDMKSKAIANWTKQQLK